MKVLVTGSSGQLGAATVKHLTASGFNVYGIDVLPSPTTDKLVDIKNKPDVEKIVRGFDAIIHTAAVHGKHYALGYPREAFIDTNINGTLNLLNASINNNIDRFLYCSTTSIYGYSLIDNEKAVWVDELLAEKPRDIYDITKQATEQLCKDFFYKEGLQVSAYRVGRFLPETDNLRINHRLYRGLDERDGAEAFRLALNTTFNDFEIFNISAGSPFSRDETILLKHSPREVILKHYPEAENIYQSKGWKFPESIDRVYSCDKAKRCLGYKPQYTFEYLLHH